MRTQLGIVAGGAAGIGLVACRLGSLSTSTTDGTTFATGTYTPTGANLLCLIAITHAGTATLAVATSVAGSSITGAAVKASVLHSSSTFRTEIWTALSTASAGAVTVTYPATNTGSHFEVYEFTNVNTATGTHGVVQSATQSGSSTDPTVSMAAFSDGRNATFVVFGRDDSSSSAPKAGWTELRDSATTVPSAAHETQFIITNDLTPTATNANVASWGGVAVEIASS